MAVNKDEIESAINFEEMRRKIRLDLSQEKHWDIQQQHWTAQQMHWKYIAILAAFAILVNSLKSLWA